MSKKNQSKPATPNQKPSAQTAPQGPATENEILLELSITELDLNEETIDHLVEQGIKTLGHLIEFSRDQEALEAVLETDACQQVLSLVAAYETDASETDAPVDRVEQSDPSVNQTPPTEFETKAPVKPNKKGPDILAESNIASETSSSLQPQASSLSKTDSELRKDFLAKVKEAASKQSDDKLARMLSRATQENDRDIIKIVTTEIDRRFELERQKQMTLTLEIQYSDLQRRGYSASQESVSRFLHRQRLTHEAGVALARIHLAMKEGGVKLRSGKRVSSKSQVIQKLLEMAYEGMGK